MSPTGNGNIRVLHVDDEPDFADLTGSFLEREDDRFSVETATSADDGLGRIRDRPPDCVVSDYNMPGMDGLDFLQAVREEHPGLPFVLFTGKGSEAVASEAISAGVTDYLQKQGGTGQYELLANRIRNAVRARRDAERATRQEQLMRLTEFAGDTGGWELDGESGTILLTAGTRRIIGRPDQHEIPLEEAMELFHPDDRDGIQRALARAFETGEKLHHTWRLRPGDGDERCLEMTITPVVEDGEVTKLRGAGHDVTEQEDRRRELERTRDLMSDMEELAGVGAWEYDPETETTAMTDGTYRIHGLEPDADLTLEEAFEYLHPEDHEPLTDRFTDCLETGEPYEMDVRLATAEGIQRWVTVQGERADKRGSDGVIRGYIRDITGEKRRERQLTELNRAMQDLLMAETRQEVADIGVEAAREILDLRANAIHLSEDDDTRLVPVAQTDALASLLGDVRALPVADSVAGRVYERGEPAVIEDVRQDPDIHNSETDLRGHVYLPLAEHGILIAGSEERAAFDQQDVALGELLSGNLVTALDRIDREQTARRRRERLSLFFDESPVGAVQWDDEFRFERLNGRAEDILGYSEQELRGESWEAIVVDEDRSRVDDAVETLLDTDGGICVVNRNVREDGETVICEWHNRAVTDADGNVRAAFSKFQDVTERERAGTKLREYETIIEALTDAVYVLDEEGRFTYVNDEFVAMVGYDRERVLGSEPSLVKDDDAVERTERELGRLLSSDGPETVAFEVTLQPRDGDPIVCQDRMGVLPYDGDQFDGSVGTLRDITDRKARERELEGVNRQYQTLIENFPDGAVFMFDTGLQYVRVGGRELTALGLSPDDIVGATPHDVFPEGVADELAHYYRDTLNGASHTFDQEFGGEQYQVRTVPVRTGDGEIAHGMAVSKNVTERFERRRQLERQNERLEEFASIVSHDLQNPLNVVDGNLELARDTCESPYLGRAADAVDRCQALIDDLLLLAREGDRADDIEPVALATVAENGWQTVDTKRATLEAEVSQVIEADRGRLRQLFENLYRNAVEHGGEDVTVRVGATDRGFYVADTGPGIPEADRETVFEPGYTTSEEGTGLGLRIVEQSADAHGWEVAVTESEQGGARIEFTGVEFEDR